MHSSRSFLYMALAASASAASLADVCTTQYVHSALPANGFLPGVSLTLGTVNAVTNYTAAAGSANPGKSGLEVCNVTFSYTHAGRNGVVSTLSSIRKLMS